MRIPFFLTIGLSAFLLFVVQPIISKMILPHLGGGPAVWTTAVMFFQGVLLAGYVYAHYGPRWLGERSFFAHGFVIVLSFIALPFGLHIATDMEGAANPILWSLIVLSASVGPLFFVLSTNAPLVQHWYGMHPRMQGKNPYMLYAISNAASLIALLGFPFLIEPYLPISEQTHYWTVGYLVLVLGVVVCMRLAWSHLPKELSAKSPDKTAQAYVPASWEQRILWLVMAAIPSSLMLGITTYISSDIAAVPLFWVLPLAIYLLSFVLTFSRLSFIYRLASLLFRIVIPFALLLMLVREQMNYVDLIIHSFAFTLVAIVFHGALEESKPPKAQLTEFYLWLAIGGFVGGLFNGLFAPLVFRDTYEYVIALFLAVWLYPHYRKRTGYHFSNYDWLIAGLVVIGLFAFSELHQLASVYFSESIFAANRWLHETLPRLIAFDTDFWGRAALLAILLMLVWSSRPKFSLAMLGMLLFSAADQEHFTLYKERNFFGVSTVTYNPNTMTHRFTHGTTMHGMQSTQPEQRAVVTSYYSYLDEVLRHAPEHMLGKPIAGIGLGVGTVACLLKEGQTIGFFEINPHVQFIARDSGWFTYLGRDCKGQSFISMGDARIKLQETPANYFGFMILDAYNSDALPIHLLTKEAVELYLSKLREEGILAFHITNRHMDLGPAIADILSELGLVWYGKSFDANFPWHYRSVWLMAAREDDTLRRFVNKEQGWVPILPSGRAAWTDDYSNILQVLNYFK